MNGYRLGFRLALKSPPWLRYLLTLLFLLVLGKLLLSHYVLPRKHYRLIIGKAEQILQAQKVYYLSKENFTGDLDKLDISLPPAKSKELERPRYISDPFQGAFLTAENTTYITEKGDRFYFSADSTGQEKGVEIIVFGKDLPVAYRIRAFYPYSAENKPRLKIYRYCYPVFVESSSLPEKQAMKICQKESISYK